MKYAVTSSKPLQWNVKAPGGASVRLDGHAVAAVLHDAIAPDDGDAGPSDPGERGVDRGQRAREVQRGGLRRRTRPLTPGAAPAAKKRRAPSHTQSPALEQVGNPLQPKRTLPSGVPHYADTDEHAAAVDEMAGRPVAEIAQALGIPERTVRRIQADLGIDVAS